MAETNPGSCGESGEGECDWFERNDHPLLNSVILNNVFKYLRSKDLKVCRGVCKEWNILTIPFTRLMWKVIIFGNESSESQSQPTHKTRHIQNFVELFRSNKLGIPFTKYRLGSFCMTDEIGQEFLKLCGDTAKDIDLRKIIDTDISTVEDISELLRSTPNLESIRIPKRLVSRSGDAVKLFPDNVKPKLTFLRRLTVCGGFPTERNKICPTFFEELITSAENISYLSISDTSIDSEDTVSKSTIVEVLTIIEKLGRESVLQNIKIVKIGQEVFETLQRMNSNGLKLKKLKIQNIDTASFSDMIQLISLFKNSVERLHFSGSEFCTSLSEFPKMSSLTSLSMNIPNNFDTRCTNFIKIFPALENLCLHQRGPYRDYDEFLPNSESCPKMKSFKLISASIHPRSFTRCISTVFPNLTVLCVNIRANGVETIRIIWSQMTQLTDLTLYGRIPTTENLDSLFIGIPIQVIRENDDIINELDKMTQEVRAETILRLRSQHCQLPSIMNLINLSSLSVRVQTVGNEDRDEYRLSDRTGFLGLYSMKHLRHLRVNNCKFTRTCCQMLIDDLGLETFNFMSPFTSGTFTGSLYPIYQAI